MPSSAFNRVDARDDGPSTWIKVGHVVLFYVACYVIAATMLLLDGRSWPTLQFVLPIILLILSLSPIRPRTLPASFEFWEWIPWIGGIAISASAAFVWTSFNEYAGNNVGRIVGLSGLTWATLYLTIRDSLLTAQKPAAPRSDDS